MACAEAGPSGRQPAVLALASWLARRLERCGWPASFGPFERCARDLMDRAGLSGEELARGVVALSGIGLVLGGALAALQGRGPAAAATFACAAGALPLAWFLRAARRRLERMEEELPFALDMLMLSVEAGCDLAQALMRLAEKLAGGPLADELGRVSAALRTGASRREALTLLSRRANPADLAQLARMLAQADRTGAGAGQILRSASSALAEKRLARAERRGARASQKLLAPLILCIMPSTFIVVFGPIAVRIALHGVDGLMG
ncbi:MAG: type II secretion system F family protein [Planctomycetota bacterium]